MTHPALQLSYAYQTCVCSECTLSICRGERVVYYTERLAADPLTKRVSKIRHTLCESCGQEAEESLTCYAIDESLTDLIKAQEG
jgi:hypothetical protein